MKYLLMYWDDDAADPGPADDPAFLAELRTWVDGMTERGTRLHGAPLGFAREAKLLRVRDLAVAAAHPLARSCTVELRPVDLLPWEPGDNPR
jgi:hypothetical protein